MSAYFANVVRAGGGDGLTDHLLTHNAHHGLLDVAQEPLLRKTNKHQNKTQTVLGQQIGVTWTRLGVERNSLLHWIL